MAKGIFDETRRHVQHVMRVLDSKQQDMLDAIANTMVSFQESMQDKGLWSTECVSLSQYAYCLHRQHMALESGRVLSDALDILNTIETNVVPAPSLAYQQGTVGVAKSMPGKAGKNGANGIARSFETHGYKISQRTLLLAEAMTERLASLHLNGPKEDRYKTMQLLHATKNIVHLFHAQMASNGPENAAELRQNPMRAMAFYCNCLFVSQHLGLLGMHFLETCNDMSVNMTFADLIPHFLGEGEGVFLDHLRWIKESLQGDIDGIVSDNATESEEAVHQLVARLTGVAHAWQQVAPTELYAQSFGTLVDYVITSMAARLAGHELDASKRSTGGSRTYSLRYCASHLQSLEKVFVDLGQDAHAQPCDAGSAIGNGRVKGKKLPVHKFVPSWALLEKMAKE
ncbi:hypothetical protein BC831DRAFT_230353 [Entophlyctis helioformis]|nr:hypothetical protein BC831DRAFT_230353 [Entophlyctis helioformis]